MPTGDAQRALLDALPIAVGVHLRAPLANWTYVNPAFRALLGYAEDDAIVGTPSLDVVAAPTERNVVQGRQETLVRGGALGFNTTRWRRKDGTSVPVEVSAARVDFDGEPSILVVGRDLTERMTLQDRLALADRMVSIGTLAAGVAHEINNPLTYVSLSLEMIAHELRRLPAGGATDRLRALENLVEGARKGTERVDRVVRAMKTFSRASEERRVRLDVRGVLDASIEIVWNEIKHRAKLTKEYGDAPHVEADEARLGQVFINLLVNAAQAIPEGHADVNEISVRTTTDVSGRAVIEVSDTGSGISAEALPRIFDPFFTTKAVGEGTGLGLAICHGIVTGLGGEIYATSAPGRQTTFRVSLPAATARPNARSEPPVASVPRALPPATAARVLIIDDDELVAKTCRAVLAREFDATTVNKAREGLDRIDRGERFDAILCDLVMPEMTGMEFFAELAGRDPKLTDRVVFMTGGAFTPQARAFVASTKNPLVEKPFSAEELREVVRRAVGA